jgi:HPt (histidine-containing phosphotransfer) domain-containing protein
MMSRYRECGERMPLAERRAVSASTFAPQTRRVDIAREPFASGDVAEGGQWAVRLTVLTCEPQQIGSALAHAGVSSDTHDMRFAFLKEREHDTLAAELNSTFAGGLPVPVPVTLDTGSVKAQGRCAVVLIASDRRSLRARIDTLSCGDETIAAEFMRILIDTNCDALTSLNEAACGAQWTEFGKIAHRLNGSLKLIRCANVIGLASRMEQAALRGDAMKARAILPVFASVVQSVNAVMEQMLERSGYSAVQGC